ncbi:MAG: cation diffusion facilitator family transporter [Alphaproteobacteria bacterium]|nr:cation diffusion facilitator family transporter [Alphaproteobacteria bacterium]
MKNTNENIKLQWLIVGSAVVLFVLKILAYIFTHSSAVLTDALETIINILAGSFGLYSLYLSAVPKDQDHPYGHGKIEFIASAFEGLLIFFTGAILLIFTLINFGVPSPIESLKLGIILIVISVFINCVFGFIALWKGKKNKSILLESSGKHLILDALTSIVVLINFLVIQITHWVIFDKIITILLTGIILFQGWKIIRKSVAGIMDEADYLLLQEVLKKINVHRDPNWIDLHNLRVIKYGHHLHIDCHLTVPWYFNVKESHIEVKKFEDFISQHFGESNEYFIHTDSCKSFSCNICSKKECVHRTAAFKKTLEWNTQYCSNNQQHKF